MQGRKKKWLILAGLLLASYLGWRLYPSNRQSAGPQAEDPALLFNRAWVDSKPKKATDTIHALLVTDHLPVGVFQKGSAYRVLLERFEYLREGNNLRLRFPQTNRTERINYRIRACDDLPPFDLCLELSRNPWDGGPLRFHGKRESKGVRDLEVLEQQLEEQLHSSRFAVPPNQS